MMRTQLPQARQRLDSHPGLLLQRYVAHPADGSEQWTRAKRDIHEAARTATCELYKAAFERWQNSLSKLTAANDLQTVGRLIVGLGTENVLETGIRLHHTYGMPILPGSALKGLAAHYCDQVWGPSEEKFKNGDEYHQLLFGTTDESGWIIFHDGWFVPDSEKEPLKLDVMTPHHPKWLDGSEPPTDFDSPVPLPFLSVAGKFHVAVSWHGPASDKSESWQNLAMNCLRDALFNWGIGGKTTSGYGRFDEEKWKVENAKREKEAEDQRLAAEKEAVLAAMTPIERSIQEFLEINRTDTSSDSSKLIKALKDGKWKDREEQIAVARIIKEMLVKEGKWKDKGKDGERKKYIQQILGEI